MRPYSSSQTKDGWWRHCGFGSLWFWWWRPVAATVKLLQGLILRGLNHWILFSRKCQVVTARPKVLPKSGPSALKVLLLNMMLAILLAVWLKGYGGRTHAVVFAMFVDRHGSARCAGSIWAFRVPD